MVRRRGGGEAGEGDVVNQCACHIFVPGDPCFLI